MNSILRTYLIDRAKKRGVQVALLCSLIYIFNIVLIILSDVQQFLMYWEVGVIGTFLLWFYIFIVLLVALGIANIYLSFYLYKKRNQMSKIRMFFTGMFFGFITVLAMFLLLALFLFIVRKGNSSVFMAQFLASSVVISSLMGISALALNHDISLLSNQD